MLKSRTLLLGTLLSFSSILFTNSIQAQANPNQETVIVQKVMDDQGQVTIKKKRIASGESIETLIEQMGVNEKNSRHVEIQVLTSGEENAKPCKELTPVGEETIIYVREATSPNAINEAPQTFHFTMKGNVENFKNDFQKHWNHIEKSEPRPLLGIYPGEYVEGKGLKIDGLVEGKGAQTAGIQSGDVLMSVNGQSTKSIGQLHQALNGLKAGDKVDVTYLRDGQEIKTSVQLSENRSYFKYAPERDPCKVFIGIYTTNASEGGVAVTGIVPNTPADISGIQKGDRILALDGVRVNSHESLLVERNKHQPGDIFSLHLVRNGVEQIVEAQFKSCDPKTPAIEVPKPAEVVPAIEPDEPTQINNQPLELKEFTAFPNPTFGAVTVTFQGEAVPTKFRVSDITGKIIYEESVPNFDGFYNRELQLGNAMPGNLTLTVYQNGQIQSKQVLLLNRA